MKKFIFALLATLAFSTTIQADNTQEVCTVKERTICHYEKNLYVKGFYGLNFTKGYTDKFEKKFLGNTASGAIGYIFPSDISVEAEYAFRKCNIFSKDIIQLSKNDAVSYNYHSYMINVIKDFDLVILKPYIGAGIGYDGKTFRRNNLSWQAIAGLKIPVTCNLSLALEYKFHQRVYTNTRFDNSIGLSVAYKIL